MFAHHATLLRVDSPLEFKLGEFFSVVPSIILALPKLTIDDVRKIIIEAHLRPSEENEQIIVVQTEFIIEEAQQALLKIVEEPPLSTKFVFVVPVGYRLLPTLQSRFHVELITELVVQNDVFTEFMQAQYAKRLQKIDESVKAKDAQWQATIKRGLLAYLASNTKSSDVRVLEALEYIARTLLTRGASNKFLLEQLALTLPTRS